eukprot:858608-Rhodomonas_salina.1
MEFSAQKERKGNEQMGQKTKGGARTYQDDWEDALEANKAAAAEKAKEFDVMVTGEARWRQVEAFCDAEMQLQHC